jgi:hypothetical protein
VVRGSASPQLAAFLENGVLVSGLGVFLALATGQAGGIEEGDDGNNSADRSRITARPDFWADRAALAPRARSCCHDARRVGIAVTASTAAYTSAYNAQPKPTIRVEVDHSRPLGTPPASMYRVVPTLPSCRGSTSLAYSARPVAANPPAASGSKGNPQLSHVCDQLQQHQARFGQPLLPVGCLDLDPRLVGTGAELRLDRLALARHTYAQRLGELV